VICHHHFSSVSRERDPPTYNIWKNPGDASKAPVEIIGGKIQIATRIPLYISWSKIYNLSLNMNTTAWLMIGNIPTKPNTKETPQGNQTS